jgi:hypothetical protein
VSCRIGSEGMNDRTKAAGKILNVWKETFCFYCALAEAVSNISESEREWWRLNKDHGVIFAVTWVSALLTAGPTVSRFKVQEHFPGIARNLLLLKRGPRNIWGRSEYVSGQTAVLYLYGFSGSLVLGTLWYWLRYDPEGTVNPGWTSVFG